MSWPSTPLGDLCTLDIGKTPSRAEAAFWRDGTHPWLSISDMSQGRDLRNTKEYVTDQGIRSANMRMVDPGTLLLSYKLSIGKVGFARIPMYTNEAIAALSGLSGDIYPDYMYWALQHVDLLQGADRAAMGATLNKAKLKQIPIPVPPLPEQRRIAAILDKADALRGKRRAAIAKLDQLLQSVFLDMFGDPVMNPKGWPVLRISDLLESATYGSSDKASLEGEIPILRMNNLTYSGEIDLTDLKYISSDQAKEKYLARPGDILFNRTNSKELVGKTAVYAGPTPMAYAGYLVRGRVLKEHAPEYISAFLNSGWGKKILRGMCKNIVGMANINAKEFGSIELPVPPSHLQVRFQQTVRTIQKHKCTLQSHATQLDTLFASLQHRAFAGTL